MAYVPDPTNPAEPTEAQLAQTAAAEFRALKLYVQQIAAGGGVGAQQPGQIATFPFTIAPPGYIEANGVLYLRATYPTLWAYLNTSGDFVAEAAWAANPGRFSSGDGATNFRAPDLRGEFLRMADRGRGVPGAQSPGLFAPATAIFDNGRYGGVSTVADDNNAVFNFDEQQGIVAGAAQVTGVNVAGLSRIFHTVRPRNISVLVCIKT